MAQFAVIAMWLAVLRRCALRQSAAGGDIALWRCERCRGRRKREVLTPIALDDLIATPRELGMTLEKVPEEKGS